MCVYFIVFSYSIFCELVSDVEYLVLEGIFMPEHMGYDGALEHVQNHNSYFFSFHNI